MRADFFDFLVMILQGNQMRVKIIFKLNFNGLHQVRQGFSRPVRVIYCLALNALSRTARCLPKQ